NRAVVEQDALRSAVQVLVLAGPERPQEGDEADGAQAKRDRDQIDDAAHRPYLRRGPYLLPGRIALNGRPCRRARYRARVPGTPESARACPARDRRRTGRARSRPRSA